MKTKHTPGNWIVLPDPVWKGKHPLHDARFVATSDQVEIRFNDGEPEGWNFENREDSIICTMPDSANQKANATLIASAPELLATLRKIGVWLIAPRTDVQTIAEMNTLVSKAIAKAEGREQ